MMGAILDLEVKIFIASLCSTTDFFLDSSFNIDLDIGFDLDLDLDLGLDLGVAILCVDMVAMRSVVDADERKLGPNRLGKELCGSKQLFGSFGRYAENLIEYMISISYLRYNPRVYMLLQ